MKRPAPGRLVAVVVLSGVLLLAAFLAGFRVWGRFPAPHASCPGEGALVQVDTRARVLSLCRGGREEASFRVALGSGGVGKRVEGDARTPLGRYPLSRARASASYHLFLAVGYPTPDQARRGYTGGDIGIHGPPRGYAWFSDATVWPDWTLGCIALGTRADVERVSRWVRDNEVGWIVLL
jgi:L,D-peptidoglycan transpeptidase YkuD (ErfK/YbiS/YcfS/YnhG family)